MLLVVGGVSIYLLLPSLLSVFGRWRSLSHLDWRFAPLVLAAELAALVCVWELDRIALRTRAWFPVVTTQLSANAVGRVYPGGGVTSTAFAAAMLRRAGVDAADAAAAYGTATLLQWATTLALPLLALPAVVGGAPVAHSLATAATLAAVLFALLAALRAVGAQPQPSLVLLAYTAAEVLTLLPFTPGGLGFVEAGLVGMLQLAGVPAARALTATLLYRIVAFWLPIPAGGVAYLSFRRRYSLRS